MVQFVAVSKLCLVTDHVKMSGCRQLLKEEGAEILRGDRIAHLYLLYSVLFDFKALLLCP